MTAQPVSNLTLGRYLTGELDTDEASIVQAAIETDGRLAAQVARVEQARSAVAPFDASELRRRAGQTQPAPANDNRAFLAVVPVLLAAALALFFVIPSAGPTETGVRLRGSSVLSVYHLESAGLSSYDDRALSQGDALGFKVDPGRHDEVVLLSIDGNGVLTMHYPAPGDDVQELNGVGVQALPGSIILDNAPGPEHFVAVFGTSPAKARSAAEHAWQSGGAEGLKDWATAHDVDLAVVQKR